MSELKPWPEIPDDFIPALDGWLYERARAEAALSRLHIVSPARLRNLARALKAGMSASRVAQELEAMADRVGEIPGE